jgi:YYY domain-containing protein
MMDNHIDPVCSLRKTDAKTWLIGGVLFIVLILAALLRFTGLYWGENTYNHPDERFLLFVGTDIKPVESFKEYWDTERSSLNPHNRGHRFYVYGTLPMFLVRYIVEWNYGHSGINEVLRVGRTLSAFFDLATVFMVFLLGTYLYGRRVGLLASAFSAFAILQIQQAHFFTMDTFTNFFAVTAIYFAVRVVSYNTGFHRKEIEEGITQDTANPQSNLNRGFISNKMVLLCLGFGVAMGMSLASKVNSAPVAFLLPIAALIRLSMVPKEYRVQQIKEATVYVAIAALISFLVFRIFQPYAFMGPGFFGLQPNMDWVENLLSQARMASGDVDFPPAIQWARRPVWFAWQNMVLFGLGLPLGLLAWVGFLAVGWQIIKGAWQKHLLLWGWTAVYFTWQSLVFNPSMRYQLLVYPSLVIFAAWGIVRFYDKSKGIRDKNFINDTNRKRGKKVFAWKKVLAVIIGFFVLISTGGYAYAFTGIYTNPLTRAEASRWIYQNIPGPINLRIEAEEGVYNQPVAYPYSFSVSTGIPFTTSFQPKVDGVLDKIYLPHVLDDGVQKEIESLVAIIFEASESSELTGLSEFKGSHFIAFDGQGGNYWLSPDKPVYIIEDQPYVLNLSLPVENPIISICGSITLQVYSPGEIVEQVVYQPSDCLDLNDLPYQSVFLSQNEGYLIGIILNEVGVENLNRDPVLMNLVLVDQTDVMEQPNEAWVTLDTGSIQIFPGEEVEFLFDEPIHVKREKTYNLELRVDSDSTFRLMGTAVANEGAWDDGLPVRIDGYDGFGGIYQPGLNFDMYETDNPVKLARFLKILDQTEYIFISSNRQWGSLPRLPERFPMNTEYFRRLLGCPPERSIEWCYNVAKPGSFQGDLGFDLIEVFHAKPTLGPISINTQFAEEAFTVYDHPKVFIFKKQEDFDPQIIRATLGAIDLDNVIHITPKQAGSIPRDMMLPAERFDSQIESGTWSQLFNTQAIHNRWPGLGLFVWYFALAFLGLVSYPIIRLVLAGLPDRGYPFARTLGLLFTSYLVWVTGFTGIPFSRTTITIVMLSVFTLSVFLAYRQRKELKEEWKDNRKYFLMVEMVFLAFFVGGLLLRIGNPDLWHPFKGGEKPMDFSYFNAVLKSSSFPPYDPWFAGGYINYYYYGFVLVGVLVKWLGIVPAIAINLILPTLFSLIALGAFSITWNLVVKNQSENYEINTIRKRTPYRISFFLPAIGGALGMVVLGNLGTLQMVFHGLQRLGSPEGVIDGAGLITQIIWAFKGLLQTISGSSLPYSLADWYWIPSRVIPVPSGEVQPITEFPFFTVLYADPHAHLFALPLTLLALAWALSFVFSRGFSIFRSMPNSNRIIGVCLCLLIGGLVIGVLRPTNTWDLPTYLTLGVIAMGYSIGRYYSRNQKKKYLLCDLPLWLNRAMVAVAGMIILIGMAFLLFQPYTHWYVQSYTTVEFWQGSRTPFWSYLTHWGLFLFLFITWMVWETRDWMANTPLSSLRKLTPYRSYIIVTFLVLIFMVIILLSIGVGIAWLVLLLATWAGILILRPNMPDAKRVVLFLIGTGVVLTLFVELVRLQGDIGRMNTVFKFYLQTWTLFAVSGAAALAWLLSSLAEWSSSWRKLWYGGFIFLILSAALFPITASFAKVNDKMAPHAPIGLDGMAFMKHATYFDADIMMDLSQDYFAIRWMQENVQGSPVIVEANVPEYRWGTRYTIYTGLPNVIGWNWHQRQQRPDMHDKVWHRVGEVSEFYLTINIDEALSFLQKYNVKYIIVGQLEQAYYPGPGLEKFFQYDGFYWEAVYQDADTTIYEVRDDSS